jgi:hypothetical protein
MAIRFRYDPELKMLFTTAEGIVTFQDIQAHLDEEAAAGALGYRELFDATTAETNLTAAEVRAIVTRLLSLMRTNTLGPTAVVTINPVFYGMVSMMSVISDLQQGPRIGVFRRVDAALNWLVGG